MEIDKNKRMKYLLLFCLFLLTFSQKGFAQSSGYNSVYLELGGNGIIGSLNYERLIPVGDYFAFAGRVGGLYLPDRNENYGYMFPAEVSMLLGKNALKFEAGFGYTYFNYIDREHGETDDFSNPEKNLIPVLRLGTRRQIGQSPFFLRSAFTFLFIESVTLGKFPIPWLGFSAGYSFGKKKT